MIEILNSFAREPGIWALSFLLTCALITLASSLLLKRTRSKLLSLVTELAYDEKLTKADKAWLRAEIDRSKGGHMIIAAPFAPFAILAALAVAAYEGWAEDRQDEGRRDEDLSKTRERIADLDEKIVLLHARVIEEGEGIDPKSGAFWDDPRRKEISDLAFTLETWNNPLAMVWIFAWLIVAAPLMLIAYFASGSLKPFIVNVWDPLREPVLAALTTFRLRGAISHN